MTDIYDAVVVGGGLAGKAAAVASAKAGLSTLHVSPKAPPDRRTSALMGPSVDYLVDAGLIVSAAEFGHNLTQIRIIDMTERLLRAPETLFDSTEIGLDAFGWNFPNIRLAEAFEAAGAALPTLATREATLKGISLDDTATTLTLGDGETVTTRLLIGADGKKSLVREESGIRARENGFVEAALVTDLSLGRELGSASVEFHYEHGPFTLVPAGDNRANLVWIDQRSVLSAAKYKGSDYLAELFAEKSSRLFGKVGIESAVHIFPLSTITVAEAGRGPVVLVGEAAHAFPPIGAQGLNLGLRDVADLAESLSAVERSSLGWPAAVSADYARRRAPDLARTTGMVDTLFRSLLSGFLPAQAVRAGGLWALKLAPALRKRAFDIGMGTR